MDAPDLVIDGLRRLAALPSAEELLREAAAVVVPAAAAWCLADMLVEPDLVTRVAALGPSGPLDLPADMGGRDPRRSSAQSVGVLAQLKGAPRALIHVSCTQIEQTAASPDPRLRAQAALAQQLGTSDLLVLGLTSGRRMLGVLTVGRTAGEFDEAQTAALLDLASLLGVLLDNLSLLEAQRSVATALQTSLLPRLPRLEGLELAARYVPADRALEVGGDWYDVFTTSPTATALVIGDVTGHDVRAATQMAELRSLFRAYAVSRDYASPVQVLEDVQRAASSLDLTTSATCLYAELLHDGDRAHLTWSSAGHLPPVLVRAGRAQLLETGGDLMLGVQDAATRTQQQQPLLPGDLLVLYTDGLLEDRRHSLDDRLAAMVLLLESLADAGLEHQAERLVRELSSGEDDAALLLVRLDPGRSSPPDLSSVGA